MAKKIGKHFRGNVVGYVALFLAIGMGTAYALDRNSVRSKHIKNGQVKGQDISEGTLGTVPKAANGANGFQRAAPFAPQAFPAGTDTTSNLSAPVRVGTYDLRLECIATLVSPGPGRFAYFQAKTLTGSATAHVGGVSTAENDDSPSATAREATLNSENYSLVARTPALHINSSGFARFEGQVTITAGGKPTTINLHLFIDGRSVFDDECSMAGTGLSG